MRVSTRPARMLFRLYGLEWPFRNAGSRCYFCWRHRRYPESKATRRRHAIRNAVLRMCIARAADEAYSPTLKASAAIAETAIDCRPPTRWMNKLSADRDILRRNGEVQRAKEFYASSARS